MPLPVYMDVHVPVGVTQGLRRKGIDTLTAQDDAAGRNSDDELLQRATELGRVLLTQDVDFLAIATRWQEAAREFGGVLFAPQGTPIGRIIDDAELCLACLATEDMRNRLMYLPLR